MRKFIPILLSFIFVFCTCITPVMATSVGSGVASDTETISTVVTPVETADTTDTGNTEAGSAGNSSSGGYKTEGVMDPQEAAGIPSVTTDMFIDHLDEKGNDVVNVLQTIGKWVCIVMFIVCICLFIVGIVGNKGKALAAFFGMLLSGVCYAGIMCGREIVAFIAMWAST